MSFADTFEAPVAVEFDGQKYALKRLHPRDYLPWISELEAQYKHRNLPLVANSEGTERMRYENQINAIELTPDNVRPKITTVKGAERIIMLAWVKTATGKNVDGMPDDESVKTAKAQADKFIESIDIWDEILALAMRVSGLFTENFFHAQFPPTEMVQLRAELMAARGKITNLEKRVAEMRPASIGS